MMEKKSMHKDRGLRTFVFYVIFVFVLILFSFLIRLFYLIGDSKFDGKHRYNLVIGRGEYVIGLISFEPVTSSLSLLTFSPDSNLSFLDFNKKFGIIPDGYIKTRYDLMLKEAIPSMLKSFLVHQNNIFTNINLYDFLRLYLYANKVPSSSVIVEHASIFKDTREFNDIASLLLTDSVVSAENVSVQIINAAGQSGLGGRLERVVLNFGGNVVSVKTALVTEPISRIRYYGDETYTLKKLERLLTIKKEHLNKEDIARIVIIIGEDIKDTRLF